MAHSKHIYHLDCLKIWTRYVEYFSQININVTLPVKEVLSERGVRRYFETISNGLKLRLYLSDLLENLKHSFKMYNLDCIKLWIRYVDYFCQNQCYCDTTCLLKFYRSRPGSSQMLKKQNNFLESKRWLYLFDYLQNVSYTIHICLS